MYGTFVQHVQKYAACSKVPRMKNDCGHYMKDVSHQPKLLPSHSITALASLLSLDCQLAFCQSPLPHPMRNPTGVYRARCP